MPGPQFILDASQCWQPTTLKLLSCPHRQRFVPKFTTTRWRGYQKSSIARGTVARAQGLTLEAELGERWGGGDCDASQPASPQGASRRRAHRPGTNRQSRANTCPLHTVCFYDGRTGCLAPMPNRARFCPPNASASAQGQNARPPAPSSRTSRAFLPIISLRPGHRHSGAE